MRLHANPGPLGLTYVSNSRLLPLEARPLLRCASFSDGRTENQRNDHQGAQDVEDNCKVAAERKAATPTEGA